jgi:2-iminobutanoate/2-iminopropanoate deaminase
MSPLAYTVLPGEALDRFPFSAAVSDGNLLFVAGQVASDDPAWSAPAGDIVQETHAVMQRIARILAASGLRLEDVLRVGVFMTNLADFARMNAVYQTYFTGPHLPARTCVAVAQLLGAHVIEIDCVARLRPAPSA